MNDTSCIFCKIVKNEIPSEKIKETENVLVFKDIHPKAPTHYLVIPKKHIENLFFLEEEDAKLSYELLAMCQELGLDHPAKAFNLVLNNGAKAGQLVPHLHFHFLAGASVKTDSGAKL